MTGNVTGRYGSVGDTPVGAGLVGKGFAVNRADAGLIVGRDDHDAAFRDGMAPPVFDGIEADDGASRHHHVTVDDGAPDARVTADPHAGHQDRVFDCRVAVDPDVGT